MTSFRTGLKFIKSNILTKFHAYRTKNVASRPSDLVFDPTWPNLQLVWDFIEANILTKFHEYQTENVTSKEYTR